MKIALLIAGTLGAVLLLFFVIGVIVGPQPGRARTPAAGVAPTTTDPLAPRAEGFDLFGLARVQLPREFRFRGLDGRHGDLPPADQLARHDDARGLVFRFEAHARNDWGGHARDPMLLHVVLLNPAAPGERPERGFTIARYSSPMAGTIALDDARWQSQVEPGPGGGRHWRWLAMNDHFGTDAAPRWAVSVHEPARALRLELFVWRKLLTLEEARALLAGALDSLVVQPSRAAHFLREGTQAERMLRLREARIEAFFTTLAPLGVVRPGPGGSAFGDDTAAWLDADGKALRVLRVLAQVPLPAHIARDRYGRPLLPLALKPGQYPGPTMNGLPSITLGLLYWHAETGRWRRSELLRPTLHEEWPLLPFETETAARLPDRDSAYLVRQLHAYQPPALDDAADVGDFLADAERWRGELLAGHILALPLLPGRLLADAAR